MSGRPSPNGHTGGRDPATGRFKPGNGYGVGNPLGGQVARLRAALVAAVTPEDIAAIARQLVKSAKRGKIGATRIVLEYVLGRPLEADLIERIEIVERSLAEVPDDEPA